MAETAGKWQQQQLQWHFLCKLIEREVNVSANSEYYKYYNS